MEANLLPKVQQTVISRWPIHEGDQYGKPRDCHIKRAYKMQMRDFDYQRILKELVTMIAGMKERSPEDINTCIDNYLKSESDNVQA